MNASVWQSNEGRTISMGPIKVTVLEEGTHTRNTLGMAEFTIPPHAPSPPAHVHHAHEEGFYVLEGELEFRVENEPIRVKEGGFVMVPIGVAHTFSNPGDKPARFLNTFTPPEYLHYFEDMSQLFAQVGIPTPAQTREIMERYHTEVKPF